MGPPSTADKWPPSTAYDEIITINVGKELVKIYRVHKGALSFYSGYFDKALNGKFMEATKGETELPDTETAVHPANETEINKMDFTEIAKLWVFADAHDMPALQNAAINLLHQVVVEKWAVPTGSLQYIYDNTCPSTRVRLYCIDVISKTGDATTVLGKDKEGDLSKDALVDVLRIVWKSDHKMQGNEEMRAWNLCAAYHVHEDGATCSKKSA